MKLQKKYIYYVGLTSQWLLVWQKMCVFFPGEPSLPSPTKDLLENLTTEEEKLLENTVDKLSSKWLVNTVADGSSIHFCDYWLACSIVYLVKNMVKIWNIFTI